MKLNFKCRSFLGGLFSVYILLASMSHVFAQSASPAPVGRCFHIYSGTYKSKPVPAQDVADCSSMAVYREQLLANPTGDPRPALNLAVSITKRIWAPEDFFYLAKGSAKTECIQKGAEIEPPAMGGVEKEVYAVTHQYCQGSAASGFYHQYNFRCLKCY